jgi:DNA-binding IclR family transcriptional regulator
VERAVPAVKRATAILRLLGAQTEPMGVNAIARMLGLVPSTCLHILRALLADGLVAVDPVQKVYRLDAGLVAIARRMLQQDRFSHDVQAGLDGIAARFGVTAIGVRFIGLRHMVVVAISNSRLPVRLHVDIGSRFPALISASGRCLAAFGGYPRAELIERFRGLRWDVAPTLKGWLAEVAATRRAGFSIDAGNYIHGVSILAVPMFDAERRLSHCIVAVGLSAQVAAAGEQAIIQELSRLAQANSQRSTEMFQ